MQSGRAAKEQDKKELDWSEVSYQRDIKGLKQFARSLIEHQPWKYTK